MCKGVTAPSTKPVLEQWRQPYRDGVLSKEEMEQYWNEGFLLKHDLIPTDLLESVKESISRWGSHISLRAELAWEPFLQPLLSSLAACL